MITSNLLGPYAEFTSQGVIAPQKPARQTSTATAIQDTPDAIPSLPGTTQRSSKVIITPDGDTVMQYTTLTPQGAVMRKNVTLSQGMCVVSDPDGRDILRRRSEVYEGMMLFG